MSLPGPSSLRSFLGFWLLAWGVGSAALSQEAARPPGEQLPPGIQIASDSFRLTEEGDYEFSGSVTIIWRDSRIQADRMSLRGRRYLVAEGNVLIVWEGNRIFGARAEYDLENERGVITEAIGSVLSEYLFWAKSVEKIGDDKVLLESATVTTCTQPIPYWSFSVSSATIRIESYARMWNVRLRAAKAPIIYLPYLIWPVKEGRAAGLLMPEVNSTENRGRAWSQELFIPLGRSADVTLLGRYYTEAGFGGGGDLRFIPNRDGAAYLQAFFIDDSVFAQSNGGDGRRYQASYRQTQQLQNGFRMVADLNGVSDDRYYSDYVRDLNLASAPAVLARVEFSRNGPWVSMNARELRREQLTSGQVQQTLPEIEWRGKNRKLGRTPLYLAFESSAASIQQREGGFRPDYLRGDFAPTFSMPFSPLRWLDVTPTVAHRVTYWTQQRTEVGGVPQVVDEPLSRRLWAYGVQLVGPKVFRIFERPGNTFSARFKHTIEPRIDFGYGESFDHADDVLRYDEVDSVSGSGQQLNYSLVQKLFAQRPRSAPEAARAGDESVQLPDGTTDDRSAGKAAPAAPSSTDPAAAPAPLEPVEIASLQISQSRSFDEDLSFADLDGDFVTESSSAYSNIRLGGRFNPSPQLSLDVSSTWDILFDAVSNVGLSGGLSGALAQMKFSLVHQNGLGVERGPDNLPVEVEDSTQVRLNGGVSLLQDRMQVNVGATYIAHPSIDPVTLERRDRFPQQRWQLQYGTQCCTFYVERLTAELTSGENRRELYLKIDLHGVGRIFDSSF